MRPLAALLVGLFLAATPIPALASGFDSGVDPTGDGVVITLSGSSGVGSGRNPCRIARTWEPPVDDDGEYVMAPIPHISWEMDDRPWIRVECPWTDQLAAFAGWVRVDDNPPADLLHDMVMRKLVVPEPVGSIYPVPDFQTVHWPTWLWIDPALMDPVTESARLELNGDVWGEVTATATTQGLWWNMGTGDRDQWLFCDNPGAPPRRAMTEPTEGPCSYTYTHTSAAAPDLRFQVEPYLDWIITARCTAGCGQVFAAVNLLRQGPAIPVRVGEIQAIVTDG